MAGNWNNKGGKPTTPVSMHGKNLKFENPYNFVPAPPRDTRHATLGDGEPAGHHRYHPDRWSGRLTVELTTVTPLLIPDQPSEAPNGHKTYGIRTDETGAPYLPPTSIKGALRAAYEAVTNSRMGVWSKTNNAYLALRHSADSALGLIPVRIQRVERDGKTILHAVEHEAVPLKFYSTTKRDVMRGAQEVAVRYSNIEEGGDTLPLHGDCVQYNPRNGDLLWVDENDPVEAGYRRGFVVLNGPNISSKTKERIFLQLAEGAYRSWSITKSLKTMWDDLIADYQKIHERDLKLRKMNGKQPEDFLGPEPGKTAWSRHIHDIESAKLRHGLLCYAKLSPEGKLSALYPVLISRDLYSVPPNQLLPESIKPAVELAELSPADRVFGWVKDGGHGQHKGQLRIGAVACLQGAAAIERVGGAAGVPLAILGAPKPAQARFYAAQNTKGETYPEGKAKKELYAANHGLRGRKVYVHQRQAQSGDHWQATGAPAAALPQKFEGHTVYREWRHAATGSDARSDQNRSVTAWVKPGCTFRFDIDVVNLSAVELGALLWLLNLPDEHFHRLGGGKPLGFGSVRLKLTAVDLCDGVAISDDYAGFGESQDAGHRVNTLDQAQILIEAYTQALPAALGEAGNPFDELPIIRAFRNAARGGNLPVHYPRAQESPSAEGKNYEWFVANEKNDRKRKEGYSLPALADNERGLWILDPP